jgi:hypothetical protein
MFLLQVVEVADQPEKAPVDAQTISELAAVPVGQVNLFDLDLAPIEARVLTNPWIREVKLQKHFPQTLSISVSYREPQALLQDGNGFLSYLDTDGNSFGEVDLKYQPDLPIVVSNLSKAAHTFDSLKLIRAWGESDLSAAAQISSLQWDQEQGYRVLVSYPLATGRGRAWVDLGQDLDANGGVDHLQRLSRVFRYLSTKSIAARHIWADSGKKIVVRTAQGS